MNLFSGSSVKINYLTDKGFDNLAGLYKMD